ncbi:precorrin-3B synthase [Pseudaminobacter salicylatoxidans]|uniref:precorrin-3B synthase n=1 Tax=Pseudaminobacter salicylatoxidans TaxID=93369 RepID=UPI000A0574D8|nr:precorrin-3B synthase [Pseudaminobacter salicylatoxidans]
MQTGDGLLVRLNPVAGGVSPKALIGLCESALRHGNGVVEVTARGSLQIRGLTVESAPLLAAEVDALGIAVRTGVPVESGPLASLDPDEIADPSLLAARIRDAIDAAGLGARLGPKVSVVVDGGGRLNMNTVQADVRLTALASGRWLLAVAGDASAATSIGVVAEADARDAALAILEAIAGRGREARARDLPSDDLTSFLQRVSSLAPPSVLPDIPLVGEMSGRTEGGNVERPSPVGILQLRDITALGLGLPFGHMPADRVIAICRAAETLGAGEIRFAQQRAILILGLSRSACAELQHKAASLGFVTDPLDPRRMIAACPGAPACASGRIAAREVAEEIARDSGAALDPSVTLHISGCAKGCAHPARAALTLVGGEKGAGLVVDGTAKGLPAAYRPGYELASGFSRIATLLKQERRPGETTAQCIARLGETRLAVAFQQG